VSPGAASLKATAILDRTVQNQASTLAYEDMFHLMAFVMACTIPMVFLLGKPRHVSPAAVH
jgi:DHA2 family multidrug resistance protein